MLWTHEKKNGDRLFVNKLCICSGHTRTHVLLPSRAFLKKSKIKINQKKYKIIFFHPKSRKNSKKFVTSFENREEIKPLIKVIEFNFRVKVLQVHCRSTLG